MKNKIWFLKVILVTVFFALVFPLFHAAGAEDVTKFKGVALMSPDEYQKIEKAKMLRSFTTLSGQPYQNLPPSVDLGPGFPPVGKQTDNSCFAWAITYAVKSFQEKREIGWEYGQNHLFSPSFQYNQSFGEGGKTSDISLLNLEHQAVEERGIKEVDPLRFIVENGAAPLSLMPYDPGNWQQQPSDALKRFALSFRALGFRRLEDGDLYSLKAVLASGDPVVMTMLIYKEFNALNRQNSIQRKATGEILSAHYLVAIGYDDKKNAIKLFNSYGKEWGEDGYGWLDYDLYKKIASHIFVIYDRPTPREAIQYLKDPNAKPAGPFPAVSMADVGVPTAAKGAFDTSVLEKIAKSIPTFPVISTPAAGEWQKAPVGEPLLIVPEDAGIMTNKAWLRLGDSMTKAPEFFSERVSPRFAGFNMKGDDVYVSKGLLGGDEIGRMDFLASNRLPVMTDRGVGIGSSKEKVRRIYKTPDFSDNSGKLDTYFYHAVDKDWGGVKFTLSAALEFHYDEKGNINMMSLFSAYKPAYTGKALEAIPEKEYREVEGLQVVTSAEGHMSFKMPQGFSKVEKALWPGIGVGYFVKEHVLNPAWTLTVKVFEVPGASAEKLVKERIPADLKTYNMLQFKTPRTAVYGGRTWIVVEDSNGAFLLFYTVLNGRYYQVVVTADTSIVKEPWLGDFLASFTFQQ